MRQYLPTGTRVVTIMHLCLVFSYLCWLCGSPFIEDHLHFKKRLTLYKTAMGHQDLSVGLPDAEIEQLIPKLERHALRFSQLPIEQQAFLKKGYEELLLQPAPDWTSRLLTICQKLTYGVPPFLQAYVLLSLVLSFMLLFRIEGAAAACWLLPILLLVYCVNSQAYGLPPVPSPAEKLFPTEELLIRRYIPDGLAPNISMQFQQLKEAWENFLIEDWAHKPIPALPQQRMIALEEGEFAFIQAQIDALQTPRKKASFQREAQQRGYPLLQIAAMGWTFFLALYVNRKSAMRQIVD